MAPPAAAQSAGARANESGQSLEDTIEAMFAAHGFEIIPHRQWRESLLYERDAPQIVVLDAPYVSIYGSRSSVEFLILTADRQILVETKRMASTGSVDEKLPFVFANAQANLPERDFVLVMDGDGWREGAVAWIEARAAETDGFTVLRPNQFDAWLRDLLGAAR